MVRVCMCVRVHVCVRICVLCVRIAAERRETRRVRLVPAAPEAEPAERKSEVNRSILYQLLIDPRVICPSVAQGGARRRGGDRSQWGTVCVIVCVCGGGVCVWVGECVGYVCDLRPPDAGCATGAGSLLWRDAVRC